MHWRKRDIWKAGIAITGILLLQVLVVWAPKSVASAYEEASGLAMPITGAAQATPIVDPTMTALQKEQLTLQNKQLQQSNDRGLGAWLWSNAAAIVASLLSTLVVVVGALIGFWQWLVNRNDTHTNESNDRKEAQDKELRDRAEERFKTAVTALGGDKEGTQVGGAVLLRSFLNKEDKEIYGRYYLQIFDLAIAYLRLPRSLAPPEDLDTPLPLTKLSQALIIAFKEAFPLTREWLTKQLPEFTPQALDATNIQLDNAYLSGADLELAWMPGVSMRAADLKGAQLKGAQLKGAQLKEANLSKANLSKANLSKANLSKAQLREAQLKEADLSKADLSKADLNGANLSKTYLNGANLSGTQLSVVMPIDTISWAKVEYERTGMELLPQRGQDIRANLSEADLYDANLSGANLSGADLYDAILSGAHLSGAHLSGAHLSGASLRGADLSDTDLRDTDLSGAVLIGANLRGADLSRADLSGLGDANLSWVDRRANPKWVDFTGADLSGACYLEEVRSLEGADLRRVKGLTKEQLEACKAKGAAIDDGTITGSPYFFG